MDLKRVMVRTLTYFWSFLTKSTTFLIILTLKSKNEIEIVKNNTCAAFNPKTYKWTKNELWWDLWQIFGLFWPKVPLSWESWHYNAKTRLKCWKTKPVPLFTLKRANGLKTSYGETFDKLLVFVDQKYHFLDNLDTKRQKRDWNCQKQNLCRF